MTDDAILWRPDPARRRDSAMAAFMARRRADGVNLPGAESADAFAALHDWSITNRSAFWDSIWADCGVR